MSLAHADPATGAGAAAAHGPSAGRVGPNAVSRLAEALNEGLGRRAAREVFVAAGLESYLFAPPANMVDEREVARLYGALWARLAETDARAAARDAGRRTGDYLLAHRIPKPVQRLLKPLPAPLAGAVLLRAVARHAWTFAGSGSFHHRRRRGGFEVFIRGCPLSRSVPSRTPVCDAYTATFERLVRTLVSPCAVVRETACSATGADSCRFEIRL